MKIFCPPAAFTFSAPGWHKKADHRNHPTQRILSCPVGAILVIARILVIAPAPVVVSPEVREN